MNNVTVDETILFLAFRYTIGKKNYTVQGVVDAIKENVDHLSDWAKDNMVREINEKWQTSSLGMDMDKKQWLEVRELLLRS